MCSPNWKTSALVGSALAGIVIGFFTEFLLSTLFSPVLDPARQWFLNNVCPAYFFCSTHLEFKANDAVYCETGAVDDIIRQAIDDGEIDGDRHAENRSLAMRTRVCDNIDWGTRNAIDHIDSLAYYYPMCFEHELDASGIPQFSINDSTEPSACISKIEIDSANNLVVDNTYRRSLVFCFKDQVTRSEPSDVGLPLCTREELQRIGFSEEKLLKVHDSPNAESPSGE